MTFNGDPWEARDACPMCGTTKATITTASGQDMVNCGICGRFLYNAPKTETTREVRPAGRTKIKPKLRFKVLTRDGFVCLACWEPGRRSPLNASHIISVKHGGADTLENLLTLCEACNLGLGEEDIPAAVVARARL